MHKHRFNVVGMYWTCTTLCHGVEENNQTQTGILFLKRMFPIHTQMYKQELYCQSTCTSNYKNHIKGKNKLLYTVPFLSYRLQQHHHMTLTSISLLNPCSPFVQDGRYGINLGGVCSGSVSHSMSSKNMCSLRELYPPI